MRPRAAAFGTAAAGLGAAPVWAVVGLPSFGGYAHAYGLTLDRVAVPERHVTNIVSAIVFDYRGTDTMVEELILFCAVMAVALLLRDVREEDAERAVDEARPRAVRVGGRLAVGVTIVLGLTVVAHGYITPGGGFQAAWCWPPGSLSSTWAPAIARSRPRRRSGSSTPPRASAPPPTWRPGCPPSRSAAPSC
jgi:multicomponent Na+:H+ antiporter subunit B